MALAAASLRAGLLATGPRTGLLRWPILAFKMKPFLVVPATVQVDDQSCQRWFRSSAACQSRRPSSLR
jgi:hypothetical protein